MTTQNIIWLFGVISVAAGVIGYFFGALKYDMTEYKRGYDTGHNDAYIKYERERLARLKRDTHGRFVAIKGKPTHCEREGGT